MVLPVLTPCPACGSGAPAETGEAGGGYRLLRCQACDLVFSDPMTAASPAEYQDLCRDRDHLECRRLGWQYERFLEEAPCAGGTLLDVGCGTGEFLAAAAQRGYRVSGLDVDPAAVAAAKSRHGLTDAHALSPEDFASSFPERTFDVVTLFEVLEHSGDPSGFLRKVLALLRPGGCLALSVPNRDRWPRFTGTWDIPPIHMTRWSAAALENFLKTRGLSILRLAAGSRDLRAVVLNGLRLNIVSRTVRRAVSSADGEKARLLRRANRLARIKNLVADAASAPVNGLLALLGAPGQRLFALARKPA